MYKESDKKEKSVCVTEMKNKVNMNSDSNTKLS